MDVIASLVANPESSEAAEPGQRALGNPTMTPKSLFRLDTPPRDATLDAPSPQCLATLCEVVSLVGVELLGTLPRTTSGALDWLDGIDQFLEEHRVVDVGRREPRRERDALAFDHNMALRARFAAIRRIRAGLAAPPGAATLAESSEARDQSILSASPRRSRSARWRLCQTPAFCQSRRRRQQVIPLPQPISWGSISQGMPLRRTNRMPVRAARSGTGGRPPFGLGLRSGSNGLISFHSLSGSNTLLILDPYLV